MALLSFGRYPHTLLAYSRQRCSLAAVGMTSCLLPVFPQNLRPVRSGNGSDVPLAAHASTANRFSHLTEEGNRGHLATSSYVLYFSNKVSVI